MLDDDANPVAPGEAGELVCRNPFPSMPLYFGGDADGERYRDAYFDYQDKADARMAIQSLPRRKGSLLSLVDQTVR